MRLQASTGGFETYPPRIRGDCCTKALKQGLGWPAEDSRGREEGDGIRELPARHQVLSLPGATSWPSEAHGPSRGRRRRTQQGRLLLQVQGDVALRPPNVKHQFPSSCGSEAITSFCQDLYEVVSQVTVGQAQMLVGGRASPHCWAPCRWHCSRVHNHPGGMNRGWAAAHVGQGAGGTRRLTPHLGHPLSWS